MSPLYIDHYTIIVKVPLLERAIFPKRNCELTGLYTVIYPSTLIYLYRGGEIGGWGRGDSPLNILSGGNGGA